MICPVCRSQNMDTAKFCGNCGSPFPRGSAPSSSLVNCAQGHVYSAVYDHCPYCPQPERPAERPASQADFATRIETSMEPVAEPQVPDTQTSATGAERMRRDYATLIEPGIGAAATHTDPINDAPTMESFPEPTGPARPSAVTAPQTSGKKVTTNQYASPAAEREPVAPPPPPPPETPQPVAPAAPTPAAKPRIERRTLVVSPDEAQQMSAAKGKLIGWIANFTRNPDGEDYRLRAGRTVLGANPNCDIVIEDEAVSGVHASIVYRNGRCFIKDELSSNGTFVNGVEVDEPRPLQSYDLIRIGNTTLTFVALERAA